MQSRSRHIQSIVRPFLQQQWEELKPAILLIPTISAAVFGGLILLRLATGIAIAEFTRDPLGYTEYPWYKGLVSNLGIVVWSATAGISLFSWALSRGSASHRRGHNRFLLFGALLTTVLLLDDLLMLHEVVAPDVLGIPEDVIYVTYAVLISLYLWWARSIVFRHDTLLVVGALIGFGTSAISDMVSAYVTIPAYYVIEDGGKFFGILCWAAFLTRASARQLRIGERDR